MTDDTRSEQTGSTPKHRGRRRADILFLKIGVRGGLESLSMGQSGNRGSCARPGFGRFTGQGRELLSLGGPLSGEGRKKQHTRRLEPHLFLAEPAPWCLLKDGAGARGFGKEVAGGAPSLRAPHHRKAGPVGWRLPWATSKQTKDLHWHPIPDPLGRKKCLP